MVDGCFVLVWCEEGGVRRNESEGTVKVTRERKRRNVIVKVKEESCGREGIYTNARTLDKGSLIGCE